MPKQYSEKIANDSNEIITHAVTSGKVEEDSQLTVTETGWSEEEKERMKAYGYDGLDMVRAWYS